MKKPDTQPTLLKSRHRDRMARVNKEADNDFVSIFQSESPDYLLLFESDSQGSSTVRVRALDDLESPRAADEYAEPNVLLDAYPDDD